MLRLLAWIGGRAQWVLAIGVISALLLPGPGAALKGTLPYLVALLFGLAMLRINLAEVAGRALAPRRLARNLALVGLMMVGSPALIWALATLAGLPEAHITALVYTGSAPPLGSAAAFCLMLGLDAAFALELTVLGSFLAPVLMPVTARLLLGETVPLDALAMTGRLGLLIGLATFGAVIGRRLIGPNRIQAHARCFDGVSSLILVLFLFPLFDGMTALIGEIPLFAAATLALAVAANLGVQLLVLPVARAFSGRDTAGATALAWGNRNAALALASLPPDPLFTLYVALYQFPMYFTPLVMRPFVSGSRDR